MLAPLLLMLLFLLLARYAHYIWTDDPRSRDPRLHPAFLRHGDGRFAGDWPEGIGPLAIRARAEGYLINPLPPALRTYDVAVPLAATEAHPRQTVLLTRHIDGISCTLADEPFPENATPALEALDWEHVLARLGIQTQYQAGQDYTWLPWR